MISPDEVKHKAKIKEDENFAFRTFLKINADPEELDEQFLKFHNELFADYDCSKCRNCCKMYRGTIPEEDVEKLAGKFQVSKEEFIERFLEYNQSEFSYVTKHCPCDFLGEDMECALGEYKPINCVNYPYTDQPDRLGSLLGIIESAGICPVVYEIVERLKEEHSFKKRRKRF